MADNFLSAVYGCSDVTQAESDSKLHGITEGSSCSDGNSYKIRYSSKASYEGIQALIGGSNPDNCPSSYERKMADDAMVSGNTVTGIKCVDVTLGASGVGVNYYAHMTSGHAKGPFGGDELFLLPIFQTPPNVTGYQNLATPYGFFVNDSVKVRACQDGTRAGLQCSDDAHCPDSYCGTPETLENITREMAVILFSGQMEYWNEFGSGFPNAEIELCLRHAGVGEHAALSYAVMNPSWGRGLVAFEQASGPLKVWFNETTEDMMNCLNRQDVAAIGYATADALTDGAASLYANVRALRYNGLMPHRIEVRNVMYDFWASQWLYESPGAGPEEPNYASTHPIVEDMVSFSTNPANIPESQSEYWSTKDEMGVWKSEDSVYPQRNIPTVPAMP